MESKNWLVLLLRWLTGEATRRDEKALDALAKDDPFLAEALEGYRSLPAENHAAAVTKLKAGLRKKYEKRQRSLGFYAVRIAAAGAILLGTWFVFNQMNQKETWAVAAAPALSEEKVSAQSAPSPAAEYNANSDSSFAAVPAPVQAPEPFLRKKQSPVFSLPKKDEDLAMSQQESVSPAKTAPPASTKAIFDDAPDTVAAPQADEIVMSKTAEPEAAERYAAEERKASSGFKKESLKDDADAAKEKGGAAAKTQLVPIPQGGFENLRKYVQKNLRYPAQAAQNKVEGEVTLRFKFLSDGTPTDFKTEKSLGSGCDEEAMRLLREGPKWRAAPDTEAYFSISFKKN